MIKDVYIVSAARTGIGSFLGTLSKTPATKLGSVAIKGALERAGLNADQVDEVYMGNVLQANAGQAPARQASLGAGIPDSVPCTTVNKVCASGTKSVMFAAQAIQLGDAHVVVAGGMENMSLVPHYLPGARTGSKFGHVQMLDGMLKDGLWDVYNDYHMGNAGEVCATGCNISREEQDAYAIQSYQRAQANADKLADEIVPVEIPQRRGEPIVFAKDEEATNVKFEKIPNLRPAFQKTGTVTAANASTLNDGAAALILASAEAVEKYGLKPIAKVIGYADAAKAPEWFTTAPADAMPKALAKAGLKTEDIDYFEINEAFSVVALANLKELGITDDKVNVFGGAVSLGHPLGASGARILVTLLNVLKHQDGKYGCLGICNGGGGASAMVIERV